MNFCNSCPSNKDCKDCLDLMEGGSLRRKVYPPILVVLKSLDGKREYKGKLCGISRVGMLIETDAPKENFSIEINGKFNAEIAPVFHKGIEHVTAFDILKVNRGNVTDQRLSKDEYEYLFMEKHDVIDSLTEDLQEDVKTKLRDELKNELLKSQILDQLMIGSTFKYEKGYIRQLSGDKSPIINENDLLHLMQESMRDNQPKREMIIDPDNKRYIDIHAVPLGHQTGGFLTFDVTDLVNKEKQLLQEQWNNYKDIIQSITKDKIVLKNEQEMNELLEGYNTVKEFELTDKNHLKEIRDDIKDKLQKANFTEKRQFSILVAVQEAATNALKYAINSKVEIKTQGEEILIVVKDRGKGIQTNNLPKAVLLKGFSTSSTLGQGFNLMTSLCDQLFLKSDRTGTTTALLFKGPEREEKLINE